jgi:hypothetical protein
VGRSKHDGGVRASGIHVWVVWRQFKLARTDLVSRELFDRRVASEVPSLLWDDFRIECPTGSGRYVTINEVANELAHRLARLLLRDNGRRPVFGDNEKLQSDPHFRDYVLFHEYFHGDTGRGLGASHQTGWTGLIAKLLQTR